VRRREFITLVGGTAAAWPLTARAQQAALPVVGFLTMRSPGVSGRDVAGFQQGMREAGFVEDQNVKIEYRWANGQYDRLPALAADLVARQVVAIIATGSSAPAQAAKAATTKIPIVFVSGGGDPVRDGLVGSLNRPGGNVTGISVITSALGPKRIELLHQFVPKAAVIGVLMNPNYPDANRQVQEVQDAAGAIKLTIRVANAGTERDIDTAFASLVQQAIDALFVTNDPFFTDRRDQIVALAARHAIPAMYNNRIFPDAGGLMSYGADFTDGYRQAGIYVGKILKGTPPADLPVLQPTKFELVINLKTTKALGLSVPQTLLATADEVIE
jgi:putative ABC transport system substrate-binding protein